MKQKYQNSRQSSRPETVRLQGRASPSSQLFSRIASLGLGPACSRARFLGVARPPSPNAAILESVNLGKMEKYRGCFLETARFYFFFFLVCWRYLSTEHLFLRAAICFLFVLASFGVSIFSSILRYRRCWPFCGDYLPGLVAFRLTAPPAPRLVGTRVQRYNGSKNEQQSLHGFIGQQKLGLIAPGYLFFAG